MSEHILRFFWGNQNFVVLAQPRKTLQPKLCSQYPSSHHGNGCTVLLPPLRMMASSISGGARLRLDEEGVSQQ